LYVKVNDIELTVIDSTGVYDYSWSEFALMRGDDGYLYVGDASGCSCNNFEENLDEITRVDSWQDAATKAQEWGEYEYRDGSEKQGALDMIERLMKNGPAAFDPSAVTP
jgi:hypothetical protein